LERVFVLWVEQKGCGMTETRPLRCAIYTRKSTEEGLDQAFNSLQAQRESGEAYIASQHFSLCSVRRARDLAALVKLGSAMHGSGIECIMGQLQIRAECPRKL
jgi:hypothetical protein